MFIRFNVGYLNLYNLWIKRKSGAGHFFFGINYGYSLLISDFFKHKYPIRLLFIMT
jgi:hypothetical protein